MNESSLRYTDERDKAYGITGMAITLVACDGEDLLTEIHLDSNPDECLVMSHAYGLRGNPRMSAKIVWTQTIKDLRTTTSMVLGNIACRRYVLAHAPLTESDTECIRTALRAEADEHCSLDKDEADSLFDSCLRQVDRIFRHSGVHSIANSFAERLTERRSMSGAEAVELLASLGLR